MGEINKNQQFNFLSVSALLHRGVMRNLIMQCLYTDQTSSVLANQVDSTSGPSYANLVGDGPPSSKYELGNTAQPDIDNKDNFKKAKGCKSVYGGQVPQSRVHSLLYRQEHHHPHMLSCMHLKSDRYTS